MFDSTEYDFLKVIYVSNNNDLFSKNLWLALKNHFLFLMGGFFGMPTLWMSKCTAASNLRMLNKPWSVSINRYQVCQNTRRYNRGLSAGILKFGRQPTVLSLPHCLSALVWTETERLLLFVQHVLFFFFLFLNNFGLVRRECEQFCKWVRGVKWTGYSGKAV